MLQGINIAIARIDCFGDRLSVYWHKKILEAWHNSCLVKPDRHEIAGININNLIGK
jgi:hypothetical protein